MNVNDSEVIASVLSKQQYTSAPSAAEAGVVLLNTCAIRCASVQACQHSAKLSSTDDYLAGCINTCKNCSTKQSYVVGFLFLQLNCCTLLACLSFFG